MAKYKGIDVSLYQGDIDWKKVRASGVDFAMIKASQGKCATCPTPFADPKFEQNIKGAAEAGIMIGAYHYLCAGSEDEAKREATYFAEIVKPHKKNIRLWAAVDVEDDGYMGKLSREAVTKIVQVFCDTVAAAGLRPMVYANTNWLSTKFTAPAGIPVWEARVGGSRPTGAKIWQHSFTGRVDGISGDVDLNEGYDIIGDANADGAVDAADAVLVLRHAAGWDVTIDEGQADVDGDGEVTAADAVAILRLAAESSAPKSTGETASKAAAGKKSLDDIAAEVISGKWGNGEERKKRLTAAGYDYAKVQARVEELMRR